MRQANVIFSVGVAHPLYNKPVAAVIESEQCGYDGRRIFGRTIEPVKFEADPCGLLVYDANHKFIGYKTRPEFSQIHRGYIERVID